MARRQKRKARIPFGAFYAPSGFSTRVDTRQLVKEHGDRLFGEDVGDCTRRKRDFLERLEHLFARHPVAVDQIAHQDNPLRKAGPILRELVAAARRTRELVESAALESRVVDLACWGSGVPASMADTLAALEAGAEALRVRSSKAGAPTTWATKYTMGELIKLHAEHGGDRARRARFVIQAMLLLGEKVTRRQVLDVVAVMKREGRFSDDE